MHVKFIILLAILDLSAFIGCTQKGSAKRMGAKPNILFLLADDQCYKTIRSLGNQEIHTPNLDKLVDQGVAFTHAFNMGSWQGAVCVASRTMLNTGRVLWKAHEAFKNIHQIEQEGKTWGQLMNDAGYETYMTGKWHVNGLDPEDIFDHTGTVRGGMPEQTEAGYGRPKEGEKDPWSPYEKSLGGYWKGGKHWSEVVADEAMGFIDHARSSERPFFMYLAFNSPHDPRQSPKKYVDMYPYQDLEIPESFMPLYPFCEAMTCGPGQRDASLAPFPRTEYAIKVHRQEYYAIITHMDEQIGKITEALKKSGLMDNTYIIFTADHGLAVGHHGLMGKRNMFDHSIRVPLLIAGPGIPQNQKKDQMVYLQDAMVTCLEIAGVNKPDFVDFNSFLSIAKGAQDTGYYQHIYGALMKHIRMMRSEEFKLILLPVAREILLFDLKTDPEEINNLYGGTDYKDIAIALFNQFDVLKAAENDTLEFDEIYPELAGRNEMIEK